jgi:hypothetical protein
VETTNLIKSIIKIATNAKIIFRVIGLIALIAKNNIAVSAIQK